MLALCSARHLLDARGGCLRLELRRRLRFQRGKKLRQDLRSLARHPQIAREGPHRRRRLENVDVDVRPERIRVGLHVAREPRHVDIDQQADIRLGQMLAGLEAEKARAVVRDIGGGVAFEHRDAGEFGELQDQLRGARIAAGIAGDQDRVLGLDQPVGELCDQRRDRRRRRPCCRTARRRSGARRRRSRIASASRAASSDRPGRAARSA